jgi:hypothetical protein
MSSRGGDACSQTQFLDAGGGFEMPNFTISCERAVAAFVVLWCVLLSGCGSVAQSTKLEPGFVPTESYTVSIGEITNASPPIPDDEKLELDPVEALRGALVEKLTEREISTAPVPGIAQYLLLATIKEYRPGDAGKRWMMPGWGSTILWVESELREGDEKVAQLSHRRTVDAGGLYTAGAYKSIFGDVATDIANGLKEKLTASQ